MSLLDENAEILIGMSKGGSDLGSSRTVDFSHVFPDQASAELFAAGTTRGGFATDIEEVDRDEDPWDVTVSKGMVPSAENITKIEKELDALARTHGGRSDGWGFFHI